MTRLKPVLLALLALLPASSAFALRTERLARFSPASGQALYQEVVSGSAIVRFKTGVSTEAARAALPAGFSVASVFERFGWSEISLPPGLGVAAGLARLTALPQVEWAAPNRAYRPRLVPDDPFIPRQYQLSLVQAFGAWEYETGTSSRTTVVMIDTGIDASHPDLLKRMTGVSRYVDPNTLAVSDNQPATPTCNHATRAAGMAAAAANNSVGVAGMAWGDHSGLLSMKVFSTADCDMDCCSPSHDCSEFGNTCGTSETAIAAAINDVIPRQDSAVYGRLVINMSLGSSGSCSPPLQAAVSAASAAHILMFAAAGNEGLGYIDSPANCSGVCAVGATDDQDSLASFSNTDPLMASKGLTAPGVAVYTTDVGGGYVSASGTSFASPLAAGLAALVWSARPAYSNTQVFDVMKNSADDLGPAGPDSDYGFGRINAMKALRLAETGTTRFAGTDKAVAYPNPFRPGTQRLVTFTVPKGIEASGVEVKVYTSEGEQVKKLTGLTWDGNNEAGSPVASGVYLFKVKTDKDHAVGRFALIR